GCLLPLGRLPVLVREGLDLDDAALRDLPLTRFWRTLAALLPAVEAKIRVTCALVPQLSIADHLRVEKLAKLVQQVLQRRVVRRLAGSAARATDLGHALEIGTNSSFNGRHYLLSKSARPFALNRDRTESIRGLSDLRAFSMIPKRSE